MFINQETYFSEGYGEDDAMVRRTIWNDLSSLQEMDGGLDVLQATQHRIDSNEYLVDLGFSPSVDQSLYNWEYATTKMKAPFYFYDDGPIVGGMMTALSPRVIVHSRAIYNALDFLGDVGGLQEALNKLGIIFMTLFSSRGLQGYLVSSLFKIEGENERVVTKNLYGANKRVTEDSLMLSQ